MKATSCVLVILCLLSLVLMIGGCGNVTLKGDALMAAERSALDAYQASQRADAEPATPAWQKAYLRENYTQWRSYVRSAKKDLTWGPKLAAEGGQK